MLAGLISNPSGYDPKANPNDALARRNLVLQNMADQGYITQGESQQYSQQHLPTASDVKTPAEDSAAPYFTSWMRQQLVDKYGAGEAFGGGLQVTSTLDLNLQDQVQQIAYDHTAGVGLNSAVVVLERHTNGGVEAMVGGYDYRTQPFNLATQGQRQPGSAFKPLHPGDGPRAGALARPGLHLRPAADPVQGQGPQEGRRRQDRSRDLPRPQLRRRVPGLRLDRNRDHLLRQLGLFPARHPGGAGERRPDGEQDGAQPTSSTPDVQYSVNGGPFEPYNPALILGGLRTGVTPLEMAHAYQTLQHNGQIVSGTMADSSNGPVAIEKVQDSDDNLVETNDGDPGENKVETEQEISPEIAATARGILHTVVTSGTGRSAYTGDPSEWGKTGTTENNGDAWFVGATKDVTVAVWVGRAGLGAARWRPSTPAAPWTAARSRP